jgi:NAD(P)-dependent dehydrogenase (short-subunit alcohol dehydrogenase family)
VVSDWLALVAFPRRADVMVASPFEADQARVHNITEDEVLRKVFLAMTCVDRLATVAEVAELRASLCSSAASHVSGASLTVTVVGRPVEREVSLSLGLPSSAF